jgi:TIR domain
MAKVGLFLSYASEEKAFAEKLHEALKDKFDIWFDQEAIRLGENIAYRLPEGIRSSEYAVVVLSRSYIAKKWTQEEFMHLIALETADRKIILPIWHNVTEEEVRNFYPALTLRNKIPYDLPMNAIVVAIETGTGTAQKAREVGDPLRKEYSQLEDALANHYANERLIRNGQGVRLIAQEVSYLLDVFIKRVDQVKGSMPVNIERKDQRVFNSAYCPAVQASGSFRVNVEVGYLSHNYVNDASRTKLVITLFAWPEDTPPMLAAVYGQRDELRQTVFTPRFTVSEKVQWKNDEDATIHTSEQVGEIALTLFKEEIQLRLDQSRQTL